jgi:hypothetical protein
MKRSEGVRLHMSDIVLVGRIAFSKIPTSSFPGNFWCADERMKSCNG